MQFEHLVEINDLGNPAVADLTREEVWFGLLYRAEDPAAFLPGLDQCRIVERSDRELVRDLDFGATTVRDRVTFEPLEWMCFEIEPGAEHAGGSLRISIEEPRPMALFLRFLYRTTLAEGTASDGVAVAEYVKSAYEDSDIETVRLIRRIAEQARPH
ncbi:MAG: DUF1857 family protein [Zoogloeaceae bacterium]|nr:DUF1857 family protein [Rhodocyclaceae bacterium]MCP5237057.1 DUF1857 family protein [Zoogloeaceae bacterium]